MRGATPPHACHTREGKLFQSTRPVRGATSHLLACLVVVGVSIHAPRAGRDVAQAVAQAVAQVSIHAPRAGRDHEYRIDVVRS